MNISVDNESTHHPMMSDFLFPNVLWFVQGFVMFVVIELLYQCISPTTTQRNPPDHDTISRINSKDTNLYLSKIAMNEIKKHFYMASKV